MVFIAPTVHYSALATIPPSLTTSTIQQSITHTTSVRSKLSRIFKRLLNNEHTITTEFEQHIQLPNTPSHPSETIEKVDNNEESPSPNNNNSGNRTVVAQVSPKSMSSSMKPLERLPFTEPYFSISSKNDKLPFELSAYHKHCIHQQKYIDQKHYIPQSSPIKQTRTSLAKSSLTSTVKSPRADLAASRLQNSIDQSHQFKANRKLDSTRLSSESASIEDRIGIHYASRRNSHSLHSSYNQEQTQRLRRLHSKSKVRPIPTETKCPRSTSSISSSIAHRIELLKQAMHNTELEYTHPKSEQTQASTYFLMNRETQTNDSQLKSSEIHLVHHHHIHSSSFLSLPWRTYLSLMGTLTFMFFLLIELSTIIF